MPGDYSVSKENQEGDQQPIDALGSGQSLEKEDAAEAVRVFRKDACARLTGDSDTLGRSGARQCDGKAAPSSAKVWPVKMELKNPEMFIA